MSKSRNKWLCLGCKVDTGKINEHYMLIDAVWNKVHNSAIGMFCIGCFEMRLGRTLTPADFNNSYVNAPRTAARSHRLAQRLGYAQ